MDPSSSVTHLTLAGVFVSVYEIIEAMGMFFELFLRELRFTYFFYRLVELVWDKNEESFKLWNRDKKILNIAQRARTLRLEKARSSL